jgi:hypothetical protein
MINKLKLTHFILIFLIMNNAFCQQHVVNYVIESDSTYSFYSVNCNIGENEVINSKQIKKDSLAFKYDSLLVFIQPQISAKFIGNIQSEIEKRIDKSEMPQINYITFLYLIISKDGKVYTSWIRTPSGNGCKYDAELSQIVNSLGGWSAAIYNEKPVASLIKIKYNHVFY